MSIALIGDIAFTGLLSFKPEQNIERFTEVAPLLDQVDLVFANLEVPVKVSNEQNEYKNFIHYSLPKPTKDLLKLLNIGCVSLANNHIYDCKMSGLRATIKTLTELGIYHTGAGWKKEHIEPVITELHGQKIGFAAYVDQCTNPKTENFPELLINYFKPNSVIQHIIDLKQKVDMVIISIHWGKDYSFYPNKQQVNLSRNLIDAGANIIMGHHPHTLQPFEIYKQGHIFYSMGGLTFGDFVMPGKNTLRALSRKTKQSVIVGYNLSNNSVDFIPTRELKGNFIQITKRNYLKWTNCKWQLFKFKNSSSLFRWSFDFKEKVLDRVYEYFFGYYQNPLRRLFQFSNLTKINRLFKDLLN